MKLFPILGGNILFSLRRKKFKTAKKLILVKQLENQNNIHSQKLRRKRTQIPSTGTIKRRSFTKFLKRSATKKTAKR